MVSKKGIQQVKNLLINSPDWVKSNTELLEKLADKSDEFIKKVDKYYSQAIPKNTPKNFNGEGIYDGIRFNKYGHPELFDYVSDSKHIVNIDMQGNYTSDMTSAKKALEKKLDLNEKIIKANTNGGWSPFYIEKDGVKYGPFTWHHHQNCKSMYPVKKEIHDKIIGKHTGGREIVKQYPELIEFFNQK